MSTWSHALRRARLAPDLYPFAALFLAALVCGVALAAYGPRPAPIAPPPDLEAQLVEIGPQRATWAVVSAADLLIDPARVYLDTVHGLRPSGLTVPTVYAPHDAPVLIDVRLDADVVLERGLVVYLTNGRRLWLPVDPEATR